MLYGQIYADFLQHCRRAQPPRPWGRFAKQADIWLPPQDTAATLTDLRQKHGAKHLIRSGVAIWGSSIEFVKPKKGPVVNPDANACSGQTPPPSASQECDPCGKVLDEAAIHSHLAALSNMGTHVETKGLLVNPILCGTFSQIVPLRALPKCNPFNLLTGEGAVGGQLPCCAALHDCRLQKAIHKMGFLCLTLSLGDMMAFRAAGIPAAIAVGLEHLTRKTVREFSANLGLSSNGGLGNSSVGPAPASPAPTSPPQKGQTPNGQAPAQSDPCAAGGSNNPSPAVPPRLFLVDWSPAQLTLNRPDALDDVQRNLTNIINCTETDFNDVLAWRPTAADLQKIIFSLANGTRKDVQRAIVNSLRGSAKLMGQSQDEQDEPCSLTEARARLREVLVRPGSRPAERRRRLRHYRQALAGGLVDPLLQQAAEEPDPTRRSRLAALAGLNEVLHPTVELFLANQEKEIAKQGLKADAQKSSVRDLMKMFDTACKLTKESE